MGNQTKCIFLTGTIKPENIPNLQLTDHKQREEQYIRSIEKWSKFGQSIVFCENSNYNSIKINKILTSLDVECEYIKFNTSVSALGKGHGEAEIFNYAFFNSTILKKVDIVCKVTGRYFIRNAESIFKTLLNRNCLIASNLTRNLKWADSRMFFFRPKFFNRYLVNAFSHLNEQDGVCFEHVLAEAIHRSMVDDYDWMLLSEYPQYEGVYGSGNVEYKNALLYRLKYKFYFKLKKYIYANTI